MCPTFKMTYPNYYRAYAMNTNASWRSTYAVGSATLVLFGDDAGSSVGTADPSFEPSTELGRVHSGKKANVVYLDGHMEKL